VQRLLTVLVVVAAGCSPGTIVLDAGNDEGGAGETGTSTSGAEGPGQSSTSPPGSTTLDETTGGSDDGSTSGQDDTSDDGVAFIFPSDAGPLCSSLPGGQYLVSCECDVMVQDCPSGEKCAPWANDGGDHWNANRCRPIADDAAEVGEPCTVEDNAYSGADDCVLGAMCWGVDPDSLGGTCVPLCTGDENDPECPGDLTCSIEAYGAVAVCLPACDPLSPACAPEEGCVLYGGEFVCSAPIVEWVGEGEACDWPHACEPGHACVEADLIGCDGFGCCTAFCDLDAGEPNPACGDGQTCAPWYDGDAPEGLEALGVCLSMV